MRHIEVEYVLLLLLGNGLESLAASGDLRQRMSAQSLEEPTNMILFYCDRSLCPYNSVDAVPRQQL
jgi:hypothetical protein